MDCAAKTALWVAARRALESERDGRLFEDPFARALAGEDGFEVLVTGESLIGSAGVPIIEVRTAHYDRRMAELTSAGLRQVVVLAAGMDARAYRIKWPGGVRFFEIDRAEVLERKRTRLVRAVPRCDRRSIAADLREDWPAALRAGAFDDREPTLWLVEGLLYYLEEAAVRELLARVSAMSRPGSALLCELAGRSLLESPAMKPALEAMAKLGAPWISGTDDPAELFTPLGWDVALTDPGDVGRSLGRWPLPPPPPGAPPGPRFHFVEATKRA